MTLHFYLQLEVVNEIMNRKYWQPKSARAFLLSTRAFVLSSPMENEKFSFSIGLDNKKL